MRSCGGVLRGKYEKILYGFAFCGVFSYTIEPYRYVLLFFTMEAQGMSHRKRGNRPQPIPVPETPEVPEQAEQKKSSFGFLKKIFVWVKPLDFVILIVGGIMISRVD